MHAFKLHQFFDEIVDNVINGFSVQMALIKNVNLVLNASVIFNIASYLLFITFSLKMKLGESLSLAIENRLHGLDSLTCSENWETQSDRVGF